VKVKLKLKNKKAKVFNPSTKSDLVDGESVEMSIYWKRVIQSGDVEIFESTEKVIAQENKRASKSIGQNKVKKSLESKED